MLEQFGIEEWEGFFEGVGFGSWDRAFDGGGVETVWDELGNQEVDGILQTSCVVAGVGQE